MNTNYQLIETAIHCRKGLAHDSPSGKFSYYFSGGAHTLPRLQCYSHYSLKPLLSRMPSYSSSENDMIGCTATETFKKCFFQTMKQSLIFLNCSFAAIIFGNFDFMCLDALPTCVCVHHVYTVPTEDIICP